ncbi:hypothetical protein [Solibacillus sp. CAU 1738]|uniref:hypothetical protein n=1 Tax=Solibacillus sp. CAU 1738 TaxID=3140363 RepID=UPI003260149B
MESLLWITIGFIIIGFVVLISMKKTIESKLAFIKANMDSEESSRNTKSIIWWIISVVAWGIVSMILIVLVFFNYFG